MEYLSTIIDDRSGAMMPHGEDEWRAWAREDDDPDVMGETHAYAVGVAEAMITYLPQPEGWTREDAKRMAAACRVTYMAGPSADDVPHEEVGRQYLDDHYPGVADDPLVKLRRDHIRRVGLSVAASEAEAGRSWWLTCDTDDGDGCGHLHHFDPHTARGESAGR